MAVRRLAPFGMSAAIAAAVLAMVAADAHAQVCSQYVALTRLPDRFVEVASGELSGGIELFVYSDGRCTCDNTPYVERKLGRPTTKAGPWSCREATPDERGVSN